MPSRGRSICVTSPVTTTFEPKPSRVRNICICSGDGVLRLVEDDEAVIERAAAHEGERRDLDGAALHVGVQLSGSIVSYSASKSGRMYGSTFASTSPGRKPRRSPASTAGLERIRRLTWRSESAATASAIAR